MFSFISIMAYRDVGFPDGPGEDPNRELGTMENLEILTEIRTLTGHMRDAIINSHHEERNIRKAREKGARICTGATIMLNRTTDRIVHLLGEIDHIREVQNQLEDEYGDLENMLADTIRADDLHIRRLKRQIAILRIQNQWRQFRLMNPPPVIHPPIQQIDQTWLLFH